MNIGVQQIGGTNIGVDQYETTTPPSGWTHKIFGIANANVGKIDGIAKANVGKVDGV
jgi:hypothetical protein